ncbi:MAG TPA: CapA family protein [Patescibacteria group bacterium]|nr:CapA family protein [Patescibacteria group bacterium]
MKAKFISFLILFLILIFLLFNSGLFLNKTELTKNTFPQSLFGLLLREKEEAITLIAVGDVMLGRSVNAKMRSLNDFTYPFLKTASLLKSADLTFINLESPFYSDCPTTNEGMIFCADLKVIEGLLLAGIDIANLTNNHIRNYGNEGLNLTQNLLSESKIDFLGPEKNFIIKEIRGTKIGFLGFNLTSGYQKEKIIEQVAKEKDKVAILIVSFHWGIEYAPEPSLKQIELAHQVIDAGANLILGHHPHVSQKIEDYHDGKIVYSLGNFVFDQPWSEATKKGLIGIFTFQRDKLVKSEFKEIYIQNYSQPELIER